MRRRSIVRQVAVLFAATGMHLCGSTPVLGDTFASVLHEQFAMWDADGNGKLTPDEIDKLSVDPAWKGQDAAAIATLKLAMRSKKAPLEAVEADKIDEVASQPIVQDPELAPLREAGPKKPDTLESRFKRAERVIRSTKRDLFLDPVPDLDKFHQGRIGDCYFVSMVGAMVERDPQSINQMIIPEPEGKYTVSFGDARSVNIPPLTDVELALVSTTGDEGLWLPVREKAYGSLRMETKPEKARVQSLTDAIANGGQIGTSVQVLTGHTAERIRLGITPDDQNRVNRVESIRKKITAAIAEKRLIGAGTGKERLVPGISPNHAYAIFGFDAATDTLKLWNPHGNTFRPAGPAGTKNGYPTKAGRFEMPLGDFVSTFRGLNIETDVPAPPPKAAPSKRPEAPRSP